MKKFQRFRLERAISKAKRSLDTMFVSERELAATLVKTYVSMRSYNRVEIMGLRKVLAAGTLYRGFKGWEFMLPTDKEAMAAVPTSKITVSGKLYNGRKSFEDCPEATVEFYMEPYLFDAAYRKELEAKPEYELVEDFMQLCYQVIEA